MGSCTLVVSGLLPYANWWNKKSMHANPFDEVTPSAYRMSILEVEADQFNSPVNLTSDESRAFKVLASRTGTPVHTKELLDPYFLYTYRILQMYEESMLALSAKMVGVSRGTEKATKSSLVVASRYGAVTALPATQVSEVTKEKSRKRGQGDPSDKSWSSCGRSDPSSQINLIPQGREDPLAIGTDDCADKVRKIGVMGLVPVKKRGDETAFYPSWAVVTTDTTIGDPRIAAEIVSGCILPEILKWSVAYLRPLSVRVRIPSPLLFLITNWRRTIGFIGCLQRVRRPRWSELRRSQSSWRRKRNVELGKPRPLL
ncbi:hypothetical protein NE237_027815 [Protea cynaroides]|uniref:Uncharacterized protein n=1 Tax=Protea cynaroides TaxID=273540 RepID=A0A9Q0GNP8_9MAGN|nr:hypothetical protein NE237_027815 [Protea cynaroides]